MTGNLLLEPNLGTAFAATAARRADSLALKHGARALTYSELAALVNEVARGLTAMASGEVDPRVVAVVLGPSVEFVATAVGAVTAGLAYLPIDPASPDDYVDEVLAQAQPAVVVTTPDRVERVRRATAAPVLVFDDVVASASGATMPLLPGRDCPAYVIYTSGSTGRPKGVVVAHGAMLNSTWARVDAYGVPDRMPLVHSVAFDLSSGILFYALLAGGTLVVSCTPISDVAGTVDLVRSERITHLVYAASLYPSFLERVAADPPTSLVKVMIGSERWSEVLIDRHARLFPSTSLYNEYGPTEACVWSSYAEVYSGATGHKRPLTIGMPLINTGYLLLDEAGLPLRSARGARGELAITGPQVAIGYLGRPDLTAERFTTLPDGTRAYRSGDLVEVTDEGTHRFLGRSDRQVKVQGNRIEAGHVESALMAHPLVEQAHVVARTDLGTGTTLVGYLVPTGDGLTGADAKVHLDSLLPPYMIPTAWVLCSALPRTPNGKIDERVLPMPSAVPPGPAVPPADDVERTLLDAMVDITGIDDLTVATPLLDIGVNSLSHVRLSAAINRAFGIELPMGDLFAASDLREVAVHVRVAVPTERPPLRPTDRDSDVAPLSAQQHQIWFLHHLSPHALAYNTQFTLKLTGNLDVEVLERALSHIVDRHEILRTTFHEGSEGPYQRVHAPWHVRIDRVDLRGMDGESRDGALRDHMQASMTTPFDIDGLPLVRWHLYQLSDTRWNLFQVEHHFAHDGWSASLFLREIRDIYDAMRAGRPVPLPSLPVQYRDYARWYHNWRESKHYRCQERYWTDKLEDCPKIGATFQPDYPRPATQSFSGDCVRLDIPVDVVSSVDELCRRKGVTRFAVFLTAFALLAWRHTGERDLVIGSALSNRRQVETAGMLGMFVNALPLRLGIEETATVGTLVHRVMQTLLQAQDNQEFPLVELIKRLDLPRDRSRNPLFQLMFAFHDSPRPRFELDGLRGELWIDHNGSAKNDVNVVCVPNPPAPGSGRTHTGINVLWEYNTDLFERATAQAHADAFAHIVTLIAGHWDDVVADVDLLEPAAVDRIIAAGTGQRDEPPHATVHAGFDHAVSRVPDAIAVVHKDRAVTYRELDATAVGIEDQLARAGVGAGETVAVACGKSPELVASWVAVLRRGACLVTLDHTLPPARLSSLLADCRPAVVLCTAGTAAAVEGLGIPVVLVDGATAAQAPAHRRVAPNTPAFLTYTSGSTGLPKAVVTTHANAVAAIHARTAHFGAPPPRTLVTLPPVFDVAGSMVFWTLWLGGTVVFPRHESDERDADAVRALVDAHSVTHLNFVASFYRLFLESASADWRPSLRVVAIGGEPCTRDLVDHHARVLPGASLHNEYGPTEATVWSSVSQVHQPGVGITTTRVTVGRPLANYSMFVLDGRDRLAPVGARGELHIGGAGVAAGYLHRSELTSEKFVEVTTGPLAGTRLYRTGDGARLTAGGEFEVLGRLDDQVKIRGYRIETGEISRVLETHPAVSAAYVSAETTGDTPRLAGFVAARGHSRKLVPVLREWLADRLPPYMVPALFAVVGELPLTRAGKIDRSRLPRPSDASPVAPTYADLTGPQTKLLRLWRRLLGRTDIGIDDDFFAVGGDSLQSIRLVTMARAEGMALSVPMILRSRTVRALADAAGNMAHPRTGRPRRAAGMSVPLSAIQGWFFAQGFAEPDAFTQARVFEVVEGADVDALQRAVMWVVGRHEAFRTSFREVNGVWRAELLANLPVQPVVATTDLPSDPDDAAVLDAVHRLSGEISIAGDQLWRIVLGQRGGKRWLGLVLHHLIVDAVSWDVLVRDIERTYRRFATGEPPAPDAAPGMPSDVDGEPDDAELRHWETLLNTPKPRLVTTSPSEPTPFCGLVHFERPLSASARRLLMRDLPLLRGPSARSLLLAALARGVTAGFSEDLYVFLEGHGRDDVDGADEVVGWLTALYPVSLPVGAVPDLVDAAAEVERLVAAVPAHGRNYGRARYLEPTSALGTLLGKIQTPAITFNHFGQRPPAIADDVLRPSEVMLRPGVGAHNVLPTPFDVTVTDGADGLRARFTCDPARIDQAAIEVAADTMVAAVEAAAAAVCLGGGPDRPSHFLVHPVDGTVGWYHELAQRLSGVWRSYGLPQSDPAPGVTIADLATEYIARMRAVQPKGPYAIMGWSFGAAVAYEIARALEESGETVAKLTLVDPPVLGDRRSYPATLAEQLVRLLPTAKAADALACTAHLPMRERVEALMSGHDLDGDESTLVWWQVLTLLANHDALAGWSPTGQVRGLDLVLSQATVDAGLAEPDLWPRFARTVGVAVVDGDHFTALLDDGPGTLAEILARPWSG